MMHVAVGRPYESILRARCALGRDSTGDDQDFITASTPRLTRLARGRKPYLLFFDRLARRAAALTVFAPPLDRK